MDTLTQYFISEYTNVLNIGFVANLMIFCAFMQGMSSIISAMRTLQR